jgi:hypothetical protein
MGNAIFPEQATILIAAADAMSSSGLSVESEVTNFSESGGEEDSESVPVFGGGNIDLIKPRTQIEVSFDIILRYDVAASTVLKWDSYKWGAISGSTVASSSSAESKAIYIQFTDGSTFYTRGYNNAKGITFEPEAAADDMLRGTITFKLSPTNADGDANLKITNTAASTITWT